MLEFNLNNYLNDNQTNEKKIKKFEENEQNKRINNKEINEESNLLFIKKSKFKLMLTTLDIIRFIYDNIKLLSLLDYSTHDKIISLLCNHINTFVILNKKIVVDGGAKFNLTQNEISITCSNLNIIKEIVLSLKNNNEHLFLNKNNFTQLLTNIEQVLSDCKLTISNLLDLSATSSFDELIKIDFNFYPTYEKDLNSYVKKFMQFKAIFISMINCFEDNDISFIFTKYFNSFFDKFENFFKGKKIKSAQETEQYFLFYFLDSKKILMLLKEL